MSSADTRKVFCLGLYVLSNPTYFVRPPDHIPFPCVIHPAVAMAAISPPPPLSNADVMHEVRGKTYVSVAP